MEPARSNFSRRGNVSFSLGPGDVSELTPPEAISQSLLAEMNLPSRLIPSKREERVGGSQCGHPTAVRSGKEVLCSKSKQISTPGRISKTHRNAKLPITVPPSCCSVPLASRSCSAPFQKARGDASETISLGENTQLHESPSDYFP